jgi:hypothetical protein
MSASLHAYTIQTRAFREVVGSRDDQLLTRILREHRAWLSEHDAYLKGYITVTPFLTLAEALSQILAGSIDDHASPLFQYEHAAALIAATIGTRLDDECFEETNPILWDEVDEVLRLGIGEVSFEVTIASLLARGPLLEIPLDSSRRLGTGYLLENEACAAAASASNPSEESIEQLELCWPDDAYDGAMLFRSWLMTAAQSGRGLFIHC